MNRRLAVIVAAFWVAGALGCGPAAADPVAVAGEATINFVQGEHDTINAQYRIHSAPLPIIALDTMYRRTTLHLEALPGITFAYGANQPGRENTHLSLLNIALRRRFGSSYLGIGQTVYNQTTGYDTSGVPLSNIAVTQQWSRVTGLRLEAGTSVALPSHTRLELNIAANPAMTGIQFSRVDTGALHCVPASRFQVYCLPVQKDFSDPEAAAQVDMNLRIVRRTRGGEMIVGVRYLNYTAHYVAAGTPADGLLADRNLGVMPLIGFRVHR